MLTPLTQVVQDTDYLRPRAAPGSITGDAPVRGNVGWGTTFLGPSATFSTDPSGVIGGTLYDDYQLSPSWLTGT
jgi:hypothetical protein